MKSIHSIKPGPRRRDKPVVSIVWIDAPYDVEICGDVDNDCDGQVDDLSHLFNSLHRTETCQKGQWLVAPQPQGRVCGDGIDNM
jgi:hypothetical protein